MPILVTEAPIVTLVKPRHPEKAFVTILVTDDDIVTPAKLERAPQRGTVPT